MTPPNDVHERIQEIRERVEAATEGPWRVEGFSPGRDGGGFKVRGVTQRAGYHRNEEKDRVVATAEVVPGTHRDQAEANAELVASARSDVPWLLSLVEEVGRALAAIPEPFVDTVLQSVEKHAGYEAARTLAQVRDAALESEYGAALRDAAQEGAE